MKKVFEDAGDFQAYYRATEWLSANGYSYGSMQADAPIGIMKGDWSISKWRNLSPAEIKQLDGIITGDKRSGPVTVELTEAK